MRWWTAPVIQGGLETEDLEHFQYQPQLGFWVTGLEVDHPLSFDPDLVCQRNLRQSLFQAFAADSSPELLGVAYAGVLHKGHYRLGTLQSTGPSQGTY